MILTVNRKQRSRGAALVELAIVLLLMITLTFAVMEYGWMFFRLQQVISVARAGARKAVLPDSSSADVQATVTALMADWGMGGSGYTVNVTPVDVSSPLSGELVSVIVNVPYENIELLGMSILPMPATLQGSAAMAKEGGS
jgi:Flp pilus assembly protein TadG